MYSLLFKLLRYLVPKGLMAWGMSKLISNLDEPDKKQAEDPKKAETKWRKKFISLTLLGVLAYQIMVGQLDLTKLITFFYN